MKAYDLLHDDVREEKSSYIADLLLQLADVKAFDPLTGVLNE